MIRSGKTEFSYERRVQLNLPFFHRTDISGAVPPPTDFGTDSLISEDRGVTCRSHRSCFDLQTGEPRDRAPTLSEGGLSTAWPFPGDLSKNRARMQVFSCREQDGDLWVALE